MPQLCADALPAFRPVKSSWLGKPNTSEAAMKQWQQLFFPVKQLQQSPEVLIVPRQLPVPTFLLGLHWDSDRCGSHRWGLEGKYPMMRFMLPGEGDLKDPYPDSVCWVFFTFMSGHPLTGRLVDVGRKGCLKHSDKSLILHRILGLSSLLKWLGVEWSQMRERLAACRWDGVGGAGPHSKARPS